VSASKRLGSLQDLFRIGSGPSSSHTMGPRRAAEAFRGRTPQAARYRVALFGSLAASGRGHLTDRAVAAGLAPVQTDFLWDEATPQRHPNALRFESLDAHGAVQESWTVYSVGGGAIEDDTGPLLETPNVRYPVGTIAECLNWCRESGRALWSLPSEHEPALWPRLEEVWRAMRAAVERGLASDDAVLPGGLGLPRKAESAHARARNLSGALQDMSLIAAYALAVAEENAAGGIVVTAPTCGAAGVLPAILYYFSARHGASERQILHALATAGLFGASVKANASIAGAEVGCQGEVGAACSMAAAAAAQLLGGTPWQIEYAAEMAMEHHLGLTCDPVKGLVQIPCIERNAVAAMRAMDCAAYALLGDGRHTISFDEVVEVMYETGRNLQSAYRETARGGLAELWDRKRRKITEDSHATS